VSARTSRTNRDKRAWNLRIEFNARLTRRIRKVDATPSYVDLLCKSGVGIRLGMRFVLSEIDKRKVWSRSKVGESSHEIGRAFDKPHSFIRALLLPRGGIPRVVM
jgi:hypothetical protein